MAIIRCPECGKQISDMAVACPECGVEIKGNIVRCDNCGEVYLKDRPVCPHCHHAHQQQGATPAPQPEGPAVPPADAEPAPKKSNKNRNIIIAVVLLLAVAGIGYWEMSSNDLRGDEQTAYVNAMNSSDPEVLQDYLDSFKDAPQEHIDSIMAHLDILKRGDMEWSNAVLSNSKTALLQYLENNPGSIHKTEALHKIDSIDWALSQRLDTPESYQQYLSEHADGEYAVEAQEKLDKLSATTVGAEDRQVVNTVFQQFFRALNGNDEMGLTSTVSSVLHFLANAGATKADVITFLHKLYKDDVKSMTWRPNNDYKITKTDKGDGVYEYDVTFSVDEKVQYLDAAKDKFVQYKVTGHVDSDGKISLFQLERIEE